MEDFINLKQEQPKGSNPLSFALPSVPVFHNRPVAGPTNLFQHTPMAMNASYSFNIDGSLPGHSTGIYNPNLPTNQANVHKMDPRVLESDAMRQVAQVYNKTNTHFTPLGTCNIVTSNAFLNLNIHPENVITKHSFEDALVTPQNFHPNVSASTQVMQTIPQFQNQPNLVISDSIHIPVSDSTNAPSLEPLSNASEDLVLKSNHAAVLCESPVSRDLESGETMVTCSVNASTNSQFRNIDLLSKEVSENSIYKCGFCDLKFSTIEALLGHVNTHTSFLPFQCGICSVAFVEASQLIKHVQLSHDLKYPFACGQCAATFQLNAQLKAHVESHRHQDLKSDASRPNLSSADDRDDIEAEHIPGSEERADSVSVNEEDFGDGEPDPDVDEAPTRPVIALSLCNIENIPSNTVVLSKDMISKEKIIPPPRTESKILMNDIDFETACTVIVKPSSAGGIRKKHLFKCNYCEKVCKDKGSLVIHVRTHTKGRPYECNHCDAKFKQYAHLSDHMITKHTKERPFVCDRCAKAFNRKSHLQDHIRLKHTEDKLYHCQDCSAAFVERSAFSEHRRTHERPPKYSCGNCSKKFRNVTDYERHLRSHTKEKLFECEVCHLKFGLLANAKKHMIKHSADRPYKCEICPKAYHFEHDFKRHKETHLKKKPHPCPNCYKSFNKEQQLVKHSKLAHGKEKDTLEKSFLCLLCEKRFKSKLSLEKHHKVHLAEKELKCEAFDTQELLTGHSENDPIQNVSNLPEGIRRPERRGRKRKKSMKNDEPTSLKFAVKKPKEKQANPKTKLENQTGEEKLTHRPKKRKKRSFL